MEIPGANEANKNAQLTGGEEIAPKAAEASGPGLLRKLKDRFFGKQKVADSEEVLSYIASEENEPEPNPSKPHHRSAYNEAFVKQLKDAPKASPEEVEKLQNFLDGIDRQGIDNIHAHQHGENRFLTTNINVNQVLKEMGALKEDAEKPQEKIDIFSLGGFGSGLSQNWNHLYMESGKMAMKAVGSDGAVDVNSHIFADVFTNGGRASPELVEKIKQDGMKPLGEMYADYAKKILEGPHDPDQKRRILIHGFSQGGNIAVEMARALGAKFDDPDSPRVGHIDLPNGESVKVQILVDNPANLHGETRWSTLAGAAFLPREHDTELYKLTNPKHEDFNNFAADKIPELPEDTKEDEELKSKAKTATMLALARGTDTTGINFYQRDSISNPVGENPIRFLFNEYFKKDVDERARQKKNNFRENTDPESSKVSHSVIEGRHLAVQERQVPRNKRVARRLVGYVKKM